MHFWHLVYKQLLLIRIMIIIIIRRSFGDLIPSGLWAVICDLLAWIQPDIFYHFQTFLSWTRWPLTNTKAVKIILLPYWKNCWRKYRAAQTLSTQIVYTMILSCFPSLIANWNVASRTRSSSSKINLICAASSPQSIWNI